MSYDFINSAVQVCQSLLGVWVREIDRPGGSSRRSVRVHTDDGSLIVTRRSNPKRASLEAAVLEALHGHGAPVPRVLAFDGVWLVQEDLGGRRLSQALAGADPAQGDAWLAAALESLARTHRAGTAAGLERRVVTLGGGRGWRAELAAMPARLANHLDLPAPPLAEQELIDLLGVGEPRFIKWDARPGNAIACDDGTIAWFDWEHCGARNRLDDAAWLLGDEYAADRPETEEALLAQYLPDFADGREVQAAAAYLAAYGTFHMCVRLSLILKQKGEGAWWNADYCLARDKVGVTPDAARKICRRAGRWASRSSLTEALTTWFETLEQRIVSL
ncbi:MAG: phosphotransferase family protein [Alphaproteobacteria bacterium]